MEAEKFSRCSGKAMMLCDSEFLDACCPICYEPFLPVDVDPIRPVAAKVGSESTFCRQEDSQSSTDERNGIYKKADGDCRKEGTSSKDIDILIIHQQDDRDSHTDTEKEHCQPCHRNCRLDPRQRVTIPECGHEYCRGCIKKHCSYAILIRDMPIQCPGCTSGTSNPCSSLLPEDIIEESLLLKEKSVEEDGGDCPINTLSSSARKEGSTANQDLIKFQRLQRMLKDPSLISCTRCDELIPPDSNIQKIGGVDPNRIECPACHHVFCGIHGDAHLGMDCYTASAKKTDERNERKSESAIRKRCKPCSHCQSLIERVSGCDHIICPVCHNDFCFRCGTHIYLQGEGMVRDCSKCQKSYIDHRHIGKYRLCIGLWVPLLLPFYISYITMTIGFAIVTCGFFCCLGCGIRKDKKTDSIIFMPVMAAREILNFVFLPFVDLSRSCGIPCCFCNNAPGLGKGQYADNDDDDEEDYDDSVESEDYDEENQMQENSLR